MSDKLDGMTKEQAHLRGMLDMIDAIGPGKLSEVQQHTCDVARGARALLALIYPFSTTANEAVAALDKFLCTPEG